MTWVHLTSSDGKTLERTTDLDGSTWAAAMTPLALALLAAIAASFAVRGWAFVWSDCWWHSSPSR
ncbi:hypothetical protein N806_14940 [Rhodococcus sp. P27]|nr:hypothetical protein N806_14940 [Rhodococcus sp. P27]